MKIKPLKWENDGDGGYMAATIGDLWYEVRPLRTGRWAVRRCSEGMLSGTVGYRDDARSAQILADEDWTRKLSPFLE